jgi:hypothetical protein
MDRRSNSGGLSLRANVALSLVAGTRFQAE